MKTQDRTRRALAAVGIGVIATGAALTIAFGTGRAAHAQSHFGGAGDTVVQQTPDSTPAIASAAPTVTAQPFAGGQGNGHG